MRRVVLYGFAVVVIVSLCVGVVAGQQSKPRSGNKRVSVYVADSIVPIEKAPDPRAQPVPYGTNVQGMLFDGYPQIIKTESPKPAYKIKTEKNLMVAMRDGVRLAIDVRRPDVDESQKFPTILSWGTWGKDTEEQIQFMDGKPQAYYHTPFWDGAMEGGDFTYLVPRGFVHVLPDPRGMGNSEGYDKPGPLGMPGDIYDTIEWIAAQPWSNGKVGMMGPSAYSNSQIQVAPLKPPHLTALHLDEGPIAGATDYFPGVLDLLSFHIRWGRHGNDHTPVRPNYPYTPAPPAAFSQLSKEQLQRAVEEALNEPDVKYNSKFYHLLRYPYSDPAGFDMLLNYFHPKPVPSANMEKVTIPTLLGTPWSNRQYIWGTFEAWDKLGTPKGDKRVMAYPPGFPSRPWAAYHDENVRWYDYWLRGVDNGVKEEPPVKIFVEGINKWKFENEWPLARTQWTNYYLQPGGGLSTTAVKGSPEPESFTQPAPYLDPTVYCLKYDTGPLSNDVEVTGPVAFYLEASIDTDDTNWMVDLVDVDQQGRGRWASVGYLKAKFRALDESKSLPYRPIHPRQEPVSVPSGKPVEYAIAMIPTSCVFQKGHSIQLLIRNQDDLLSRLGLNGVYFLPLMKTVTHKIYFGKSHLLLPVIPGKAGQQLARK